MKLHVTDDGWAAFWCPACNAAHRIPVEVMPLGTPHPGKGHGPWYWNGDVDLPTIWPSIRTWSTVWNESSQDWDEKMCHSQITDGKYYGYPDTHWLAGCVEPLPEWDGKVNE